MHLIFRTALMLCTMLVFVAQALAADVRSYAVLPFKVNGSSGFTYLEKAIPSMLNSRLYWQGHFQPVADAALAKAGAVSDAGSAAKALSATGADYVIWGDVTVMGDNASLDVRVRDKAGKEWRKGAKTRVNDLIASLQGVSDSINAEVFGRGGSGVVAAAPAASVSAESMSGSSFSAGSAMVRTSVRGGRPSSESKSPTTTSGTIPNWRVWSSPPSAAITYAPAGTTGVPA